MRDQFGRNIDYMRVSITDRCNLRCRYCMPEGIALVGMKEVMTYEEIVRVCTIAAELGIRKIRVTGGEPLVRIGCPSLIRMLKEIPGMEQVTLTTNGVLLEQYLPDLLAAGLDGVNVSLDTLKPERFKEITGKDELSAVLSGIDASLSFGLCTRINAVLQKVINEDEWMDLVLLAKDRKLDVRFIELMPIGAGRKTEGISNEWLVQELQARFPTIQRDEESHGSGPAKYLHIPGFAGSIGRISAIHGKFCDSCNRVRLTSRGRLKPCLCYGETADLLPLLRSGASAEELRDVMKNAIYSKPPAHCFENPNGITETGRMSSIGG